MATFYHQIGWKKAIQETYGHEPLYLFAENEVGDIAGILPLFYMTSKLFGKRLISLPFAPYGGTCAVDEFAGKALYDEAIFLGNKLDVDYCEFRNIQNNNHENLTFTKNYSTFLLDVSGGCDRVWSNLKRNVRNRIRKGKRSNLKSELDSSLESVSIFYELYSWNMKRLGTPVHDKKFFTNILKHFPENTIILRANLEGFPIAALYLHTFKNILTTGWGASRADFLNYAPNDFMYWSCTEYVSEKNMLWVDFGRSLANSGNHTFKTRWGCTEVPLNYCFYSRSKIPKVPQEKYQKHSKLWKRLPLKWTTKIGPNIRKEIP